MSTFAYYNFQFAKIKGQPVQGDLFREIAPPVNPDESFARKQEILSGILSADYDGSRPIVFTSPKGGRQYLHHYLAPTTDGVAVMRLSNRRERVVETIDFREEWREEYPSCYRAAGACFRGYGAGMWHLEAHLPSSASPLWAGHHDRPASFA